MKTSLEEARKRATQTKLRVKEGTAVSVAVRSRLSAWPTIRLAMGTAEAFAQYLFKISTWSCAMSAAVVEKWKRR